MAINLRNYSFEDWVQFVFDHPVTDPEWYWQDEWKLEDEFAWEEYPLFLITNATRLFQAPRFLLTSYTPEQIGQGFWYLLFSYYSLDGYIWKEEIEVSLRVSCVRSMLNVFTEIFSTTDHDFEGACLMWWDWLRPPYEETANPIIKDTMVEILAEILKMPGWACQQSALHGLNHLDHTKKKRLIESYLDKNPNLDDDQRLFALRAIEGNMM